MKLDRGYISHKSNQITQDQNVLYDGWETHDYDNSEGRWIVVCVAHGCSVSETNKLRAKKLMGDPVEWCDDCKFALEGEKFLNQSMSLRETNKEMEMRFFAKKAKNDPEKCALFEKAFGQRPEDFWD